MADRLGIKIRRQKSYPYCGRLIVMEALNSQVNKPLEPFSLEDNFSIDFPSMPESIDLARRADYNVVTNMVVPDGVHQYVSTSPLEIPFSFSLHYLDEEYCPDGALTLVRIAARLHALTLPFGDSKMAVTVGNDSPLQDNRPDPAATPPQNESYQQKTAPAPNNPTFSSQTGTKFDPPATCRLELMFTEENEPGIVCVGYIKDVSARLKKPWLRGPGRAYNLPSWGEFSFTFVHRPGHGNSYSNKAAGATGQQTQAYADLVRQNFYNTRQLAISGSYRGFTP